MKGYFIPTDKINHLQCESIERLVERAKHAHHTDIDMRINGAYERFEADWIKHILVLADYGDMLTAQMEIAELRERLHAQERLAKYYMQFEPNRVAAAEQGKAQP